jgi:methionyl-tRNA synthetase
MGQFTTVCTAIPYVNSVPHIGNILTDLCGDVTARYLRMRGENVFFQVGTDENGLKIKEAAENQGREPLEFVAEIAQRFRDIFDATGISYDDFIRTTEPRHIHATQALFTKLQENGHIYLGTYEGWYDVSTETYFREEELVDGKSPDGNEVRWVSEENFFFRLTAFTDRILAHIEANPSFIRPENRKNEVLGFIKQGLRDVCITRKNPGWGIPVPGREDLVVYVWFDAVINYISITGYPEAGWEAKWPARVQWVGKDILTRFHATLWPAMLMGADLPVFDTVVAHGWVLYGGAKMAKSTGNVVRPIELADSLSARAGISQPIAVDALRHFLTATMSLENDSSFTYEDFDLRYNADLANDIGNALNRSLSMAHRFADGAVPGAEVEPEALEAIAIAKRDFEGAMLEYSIPTASAAAFGLIRWLGKYTDTRAPWALAKNNDPALGSVIRSMLTVVRAAEGLARPLLPSAADAIAEQLGVSPTERWDSIGELPAGNKLNLPQPIFPRLEIEKKPAPVKSAPKPEKSNPMPEATPETKPAPNPAPTVDEQITIDDFLKVKLRVARIVEAEPVEGADKLYKLQIVVGEEPRQLVAGIRKSYTPEELIGRQIVVVANLKPAKLRGVESQGMLLAATDETGAAILLMPDREAPEGATVR